MCYQEIFQYIYIYLQVCQREILRHKFDTQVVTAGLRREQRVVESKNQKLQKQKDRCKLQREKTHGFLEQQEKGHHEKESALVANLELQNKPSRKDDEELMKAIGKLQMPTSMKERLIRAQTLINAYSN